MKSSLQLNCLQCATILLACCGHIAAQPPIQPASIEMKVVDSNGVCTINSSAPCSQVANKAEKIFNSSILPQLYGLYKDFTANSRADIHQGHPSGYYWLNATNEPQLVYCSLNENHSCSESDEKWMHISYLNMSDPSAQCPDGWREVQSPICTCRRQFNMPVNSVNYTSFGIPYSRVCGRIIAYQFGTPEGFLGYTDQNRQTLNDAYVDGIAITFGHPRNHIWAFAATILNYPTCSCTGSGNIVPPFVNGNHFCEVGINNWEVNFVIDNPLWDGQECAAFTACSKFDNPPWFFKQLDRTTIEDIELRIMGNISKFNFLEEEDTPVELIEI